MITSRCRISQTTSSKSLMSMAEDLADVQIPTALKVTRRSCWADNCPSQKTQERKFLPSLLGISRSSTPRTGYTFLVVGFLGIPLSFRRRISISRNIVAAKFSSSDLFSCFSVSLTKDSEMLILIFFMTVPGKISG